MSNPIVTTINLVVLNGEKYIRHCLDAILAQTYQHDNIELNILDNGSSDNTKSIINGFKIYDLGFKNFKLIECEQNLGVWPGQEELLKNTTGKYVVALCVDVLMDKDFVKNAVEEMEKDEKIGALQAKIYKYEINELRITNYELRKEIIDTVGFRIERSRRIINIGHGEKDTGQYDNSGEVFAVEGACPFFRREALESCQIKLTTNNQQLTTEIVDHEYFWYGDDLDLAWRMRLFGWKEILAPTVIAWHDRQTTKGMKKHWWDYILRVPVRQQIPIKKRRLDWRNNRFTIVKNDYTINVLRDFPVIVIREIQVLGYALLFEPGIFLEIPIFFKALPSMLRKRREIMKRAEVSPQDIRKWFL